MSKRLALCALALACGAARAQDTGGNGPAALVLGFHAGRAEAIIIHLTTITNFVERLPKNQRRSPGGYAAAFSLVQNPNTEILRRSLTFLSNVQPPQPESETLRRALRSLPANKKDFNKLKEAVRSYLDRRPEVLRPEVVWYTLAGKYLGYLWGDSGYVTSLFETETKLIGGLPESTPDLKSHLDGVITDNLASFRKALIEAPSSLPAELRSGLHNVARLPLPGGMLMKSYVAVFKGIDPVIATAERLASSTPAAASEPEAASKGDPIHNGAYVLGYLMASVRSTAIMMSANAAANRPLDAKGLDSLATAASDAIDQLKRLPAFDFKTCISLLESARRDIQQNHASQAGQYSEAVEKMIQVMALQLNVKGGNNDWYFFAGLFSGQAALNAAVGFNDALRNALQSVNGLLKTMPGDVPLHIKNGVGGLATYVVPLDLNKNALQDIAYWANRTFKAASAAMNFEAAATPVPAAPPAPPAPPPAPSAPPAPTPTLRTPLPSVPSTLPGTKWNYFMPDRSGKSTYFYILEFLPDGKLNVDMYPKGGMPRPGSWSQTGAAIRLEFQPPYSSAQYTLSGTLDVEAERITGTGSSGGPAFNWGALQASGYDAAVARQYPPARVAFYQQMAKDGPREPCPQGLCKSTAAQLWARIEWPRPLERRIHLTIRVDHGWHHLSWAEDADKGDAELWVGFHPEISPDCKFIIMPEGREEALSTTAFRIQ